MKIKKRAQSERQNSGHPPAEKAGEFAHKGLWVMSGVAIAMALLGGLLVWYYAGRALPNVAVGSVLVSNQQPGAIRAAIARQAPSLSVTFDNNGQKTTVPAKDLGVVVDVEATLQNALHARRTRDILQDAQLWNTTTVPLVLTNDPGILIDYAKQHFPTVFASATEPQLTFDDSSGHFQVVPGKPGKGLDIKSFERALPDLAQHPQVFTLKLTSSTVAPLLDESKLATVRDNANKIIAQKVEFKLTGQVVYTAKPTEIASWINFAPDAAHGTVTLVVDKAKVLQFLNDKVGAAVASPPIDRKVVTDSATGNQAIIQQGKPGSQIQDVDTLATSVVANLASAQAVSKDISISSAPFKTVTITGTGKWIEVDLSNETTTLWIGNQKVQSFLISSGRAATPTEIGEFAVYDKHPVMTMTGTILGDYYYIPNIKWVSFFDGGEAFHGTYWHHNFGHPMSHGCINMTEADAKVLYDFAPVGTKVIVHA